jgi:pyruvate/2-oxoacid:ferredoxin oxidoreductase beta subunit
MLAALWFLADAASEGKDVVLMMLAVGLVFIATILLGDLTHYLSAKRRRSKLSRPL